MPTLPPQPIGQSQAYLAILDRVSDTATLDKPVLLVGERGTGKELIAARLHFLSPRWERVFISVNCAAFTHEELDRELFGSSLLDGRADTNGKFFAADEGTLFLDNIDMVPSRLQEKLMGAVEYGRYAASGETATEDVDVRVITATGIDLPAAVARGEFRADLLDRLAFDVLTLPPLRARRDDIAPLSEYFGRKMAAELGAPSFPGFRAESLQALEARDWPGNVRELKTIVERNTANAWLADETLSEPLGPLQFDPFEGPHRLRDTSPVAPTPQPAPPSDRPMPAYGLPELDPSPTVEESFTDRVLAFERRLIDEALRTSEGHQGKAAKRLELSYHQFRGLLRKHGLKK
jgi:psp operon transcriptional activator